MSPKKTDSLLEALEVIRTHRFVDLTHPFAPGIPHWHGVPDEARAILRWLSQRRGQGLSDHPRPEADTGGRIGPILSRPEASTDRRRAGGDRIEDMTDRVVAPRDPQRSRIIP